MRWEKLGIIFKPSDHNLPYGCTEFAQSPQALVLRDRVRVYFSTRSRDEHGKFLSHIAFVDFEPDFSRIIDVSREPVIDLGELGCFDEHGIFPMNVVRYGDHVYGFTCGWSRRVSVSVETSIGLAVSSDDGVTFQKIGNGPILSSSVEEPFLVGDPFVRIYGSEWHMWYIHGTKWLANDDGSPAERVYKIAHATSTDGRRWKRSGRRLISDSLNADECQALPTVVEFRGRFHMYFCYREAIDFRANRSRGYRLGYAYSDDLVNWTRDDANAGISRIDEGWDSEMMCYPHLVGLDDDLYLLYNGNQFGRLGFGAARLVS